MRMKPFSIFLLVICCAAAAPAQQSRNEEFSARIQTRGGAKNARDHNTWTATLVDKAGRQRYQIVKDIAFDVQFPSLSVANNGGSIVISAFDGVVEFFNPTGALTKTLLPFGKRTNDYEQHLKCSLAGDRAALIYSTTSGERSTVLMTDSHGNELWRSSLQGKNAGEVFLSRNAQYLAAGSYTLGEKILRVTDVFDARGKRVASFPFLFRQADISAHGDIVLTEREKALFASLTGAHTPAQWSAPGSNQVITSVQFLGKARYAALVLETAELPQGKIAYRDPNLIIFNEHGKEVARKKLISSSNTPALLTVSAHEVKCSTPSTHATLSLSSLK